MASSSRDLHGIFSSRVSAPAHSLAALLRKDNSGVKWIVLIGGTALTSWVINAAVEKLFRNLKIPLEGELKIDSERPFHQLPHSLLVQFAMLGSVILAFYLVAYVLSVFDFLPDGMNGVNP